MDEFLKLVERRMTPPPAGECSQPGEGNWHWFKNREIGTKCQCGRKTIEQTPYGAADLYVNGIREHHCACGCVLSQAPSERPFLRAMVTCEEHRRKWRALEWTVGVAH